MSDLSAFGFVMPHWFYWGWLAVMPLLMMAWDKWSSKHGGDDAEPEKTVSELQSEEDDPLAQFEYEGNWFTKIVDWMCEKSGLFVSFWTINAVLFYFFEVVMRYIFNKPTIWVHDWPHNYDAAAMITGATATSTGIPKFAPVADMLDNEEFPGTYFVAPEQAGTHAALLKRLYAQGDVGVYDSLRVEADGTAETQGRRLRQLRERLETIIGEPVTGYRSTERGMVGRNTMGGLVRADYEYFLPDSIGRRIAPKIMGDQYAQLTRIGTSVYSIEDHLKDLEGMPADLLTGLLLEGVNRVHYEGSFYNLVYDPEKVAERGNVGAIRAVARSLERNNFWLASGDEVAHWWRLHKNINADVEQRSSSRLFVRVSNDNGHTADETMVSISLGRSVSAVNVRPELINIFKPIPDEVDIPPYRLRENGTILELSIRELKPQQYRIFHIDLLDDPTHASEQQLRGQPQS